MDVHIPYAITHGMRQAGVDVLTAQEDGTDELGDDDLLSRAANLDRVVFTFDQDFSRHAALRLLSGNSFAGLITTGKKRLTLRQCLDDLQLACEVLEAEEISNQVFHLPL
jgi:predicted nuclease of predicted toxin-antitoxin system